MLTQFSLNQNQNSDCVFVSLNKLVFKRVCNLKNNCPRVTLYPSCNANQSYNGMSPVSLIGSNQQHQNHCKLNFLLGYFYNIMFIGITVVVHKSTFQFYPRQCRLYHPSLKPKNTTAFCLNLRRRKTSNSKTI